MKTEQVNLRTSPQDRELIKKASAKLHPGKKPNASRVIRDAVALAATHEPEMFFCNRAAIRDLDNNISAGQKLLQGLIEELPKAIPDIAVTISDVEKWYGTSRNNFMVSNESAIREFVVTTLFEKQSGRYPGLQFTRENIIVPDLEEVFEAASKLISVPVVNWREVGVYWSAYSISEGTVHVIPTQVEKIKNQFRCYAETPAERQRLTKVRELCENLNNFVKGETFNPEKLNVPDVCHFDHESGRFEPSEIYVKFYF